MIKNIATSVITTLFTLLVIFLIGQAAHCDKSSSCSKDKTECSSKFSGHHGNMDYKMMMHHGEKSCCKSKSSCKGKKSSCEGKSNCTKGEACCKKDGKCSKETACKTKSSCSHHTSKDGGEVVIEKVTLEIDKETAK